MVDIIKWSVILVCPGEDQLSLLADLSARRDARIVAIVDPSGNAVGTGIAEVMSLPIATSLADVPANSAQYLVHPPLDDEISAVIDAAAALDLIIIPAQEFTDLTSGPKLAPLAHDSATGHEKAAPAATSPSRPEPMRPRTDHEVLEQETAAIHRTLSRIEEVLDREALLRWLLSLATRATGATSGSIMLFDDRSEELYVAYAYGLSQHTMHATRVHLGEGIAGRVADSRQAELITDNHHPGARRDRSSIHEAICAPIIWDDQVLGVVNVSNSEGEGTLADNALGTIESLTHRFGLILDRFLSLQLIRNSELFRNMEVELNRDTNEPQAIARTLQNWALDLSSVAGAEKVRLEVLTSDGDLFWADGVSTGYESPPHPQKSEVLTSGRPVVVRPNDHLNGQDGQAHEATVFHLPVGREPLRALMTLEFSSAAHAHQFHTVSGEIIYLVNRHLTGLLDRVATADQVDRLTTLATALSDLAAGAGKADFRDRVLAAACRLTGASKALLLTGLNDAPESDDDLSPDDALRLESVRLLSQAGKSGWQTTVMESTGDGPSRSLLVVPLDEHNPFPGLVLLDKERLHPLDGATFTEFDALFARRLLPLLHIPAATAPQLTAADTADIVDRLAPVPQAASAMAAVTHEALSEILRREMDRCDRYHTMVGLAAFRVVGDHDLDPSQWVAKINEGLRSSDHTGCLEDGTILIIVPEDVQSLPRLQRRISETLKKLYEGPEMTVLSASRVYPGGGDTPEKLIAAVLGALPS